MKELIVYRIAYNQDVSTINDFTYRLVLIPPVWYLKRRTGGVGLPYPRRRIDIAPPPFLMIHPFLDCIRVCVLYGVLGLGPVPITTDTGSRILSLFVTFGL
jgi:hypothetical protein